MSTTQKKVSFAQITFFLRFCDVFLVLSLENVYLCSQIDTTQ